MDLIPTDLRPHLKRLRLNTRISAQTHGFGLQTSHNRGSGLEFAQYRAYEPGDEPRMIDWKLYARSDRHYVREAERDSALRVWVVIDTSASMGQADRSNADYSRLQAAKILAAALCEVALRQGDRFGLMLLGDGKLQLTPANSGIRQRNRCLMVLNEMQAKGQWPSGESLEPIWSYTAAHDLLIVLSDDFDLAGVELMERLAGGGREVQNIQLLCAEERDFPFTQGHRFIDPETGDELLTDGPAARSAFLAEFGKALDALKVRLSGSGIAHVRHYLDQPSLAPLLALFSAARRGGRR